MILKKSRVYARAAQFLSLFFLVGIILPLLFSCASEPQKEFDPQLKFNGGPRIFFAEDSVDLGEMTPDKSKGYSFRYKNIGDKPLEILSTSVRTVKGC